MRRLRHAGYLFAVGSAIHLFDHLRRGQGSVTEELNALGTVALILQVVMITLAIVEHHAAPRLALLGGSALALGFGGAHWAPEWSVLSDPVWLISSWTWFSFVASAVEVAGGVAMALAGAVVLRERAAEPAASALA